MHDSLIAITKSTARMIEESGHDLRGTFATHRAMVVKSFRQLQAEMGHLDLKSILNYLDEASVCDPKASIFFGVDASWDQAK